MVELLNMEDCNHCAVFLHSYDEDMIAILKCDKKIFEQFNLISNENILILNANETKQNAFAELDSNFAFHQYGLVIEVEPNIWKIVEV